ncbi:MAG: hypothetical protein H0W06_07715, partial [Chloroflexia bacterium]|nr:hypothetical protein [Chloroflexia bacterium]
RACRTLAAHLAGHLRSGPGGVETLSLCVAPHGRFGAWLFRHSARRGCDNRIYPGSWAAMYRVVDLPAVLEAWRSAWEARLAAAAPLPAAALTLRAHREDDGVATIELDRSRVRVHPGAGGTEVGAPPDVVVPWLTGWRGAAEWLDAERPTLPAAVRRYLPLLFPVRHPWIGDSYQG